MSDADYATRYGELDGLVKRYCDHKKRQTKSLQHHLEEEVAANVQLRKHVALLEARLQAEHEGRKHDLRCFELQRSDAAAAVRKREHELEGLVAELEARLHAVEERERECAVRAADLEAREEQYWSKVNSFANTKNLLEAGLAAAKKTVDAELHASQETAETAGAFLEDARGRGAVALVRESDLESRTQLLESVALIERNELATRAALVASENEERGGMSCAFNRDTASQMSRLLAVQQQREEHLCRAEDLLRLEEVTFASHRRKETDLLNERSAAVRAEQTALAVRCKGALRHAREYLDALPEVDADPVMAALESRLAPLLLQLPPSSAAAS